MSHSNLCAVPPLGWNSWNTFAENISEELIFGIVDQMKEQGYQEAGYEYIVIDDCWSLKERDEQGNLVADPAKFPHGMKAVADYVHANGFKFGMYSCCGTRTCADYPGSFEHEYEDARLFASWGVDLLKYDNCFKPERQDVQTLYRRMGLALANCGRDIVFSACEWGFYGVHDWIKSTGAHMFRSTVDINDSWNSIKDIAISQLDKLCYSAPYCHNDMDMLVVGMHGEGGTDYIAAGGCTHQEYQTHFALWAMMNSPLMIGCDIRKISEEDRDILLNKDILAINQDCMCRQPYEIHCESNSPEVHILTKLLSDGDIAITFFNMGDVTERSAVDFWDLGLPRNSGCGLSFYDCITHEDMGVLKECIVTSIPAHGCSVYRCKVVLL